MELASPSALPRLYMGRALAMAFSLGLAWAGSAAIDFIAERWRSRLDPRMKAMTYSVLPLGRQILKLCLLLIAILGVLSAWGYNSATILAGLGVGGLAVALAAQKTIENLFGGISVIGDRPVLVGDFCRFGTHIGTVMHIGLRSTRIRTLDRTIVSVPNGQFSAMELENFSAPGQDLVPPDAESPPGHDFRPVAASALLSSGDSEATPQRGDWRYSCSLYRNRHLFARCRGIRLRYDVRL